MGKIVLATIIISGSAKWLLKVGGNKEKWYGSDRIFMYVMTVFGAMTVNYSEQCTEYGWVVSNLRLLAGCLLAGGLLSAAYMDRRNCWVYNYVWWWCLPWAGILGLTAGGGFHGIVGVLVFVMLQQLLFSRMYGKADCHAFSVCALAECGNAVGMVGFLLQMFLSVVLLTIVQLFRGNVTPRGRLREPQPFIPYIITAFFSVTFLESVFRTTYIYA